MARRYHLHRFRIVLSVANPKSVANCDAVHAHSNANCHSGDTYSDSDSDSGDADSNGHSGNPNAKSNDNAAFTNTDGDTDRHSHIHPECNRYRDSHADGNSLGHTGSNCGADH